jgi:hypothetical protein
MVVDTTPAFIRGIPASILVTEAAIPSEISRDLPLFLSQVLDKYLEIVYELCLQ